MIVAIPVRTPTLAPATHTNTWVVGEGALSVFDPASPYEDEQMRLLAELRVRIDRGERVERIVLTHHHQDHVSGAEALRKALGAIPIVAHPETAKRVAGRITVDEPWEHGQIRECGGITLTAHHTPGHAPGHLVFQDGATGEVIAGDMVAGIGTILVDPDDGDLGQYLASLAAMRALSPTVLHPAHGPSLPHADQVLAFYIAHRHQRTAQIGEALDKLGAASPDELAAVVYPELPAFIQRVAAAQILSHLRWMRANGLARPTREGGGESRWEPVR